MAILPFWGNCFIITDDTLKTYAVPVCIKIWMDSLFQNDVISCAQQVELLEQQLATRMEQLQATVQSKTAVPTAQVYVSFHMLHVKDRLINLFIILLERKV